MKRLIKEFFNPSVKCLRVGHKNRQERIVIRKEGRGRNICEDYYADVSHCKRCGLQSDPVNLEYKDSYQSVSMPSNKWDEIRENGYVVV